MRIAVGSLAKYGPCSKAIQDSLYSSNGIKITRFPKKMPARESSKLGTALHEIIQDVLSQPKDCRESSKKSMLEILSLMRSERRISSEISEIIGEDFLVGSYESKMIQDLANKGETLLHNAFGLLEKLEADNAGSESKWEVKIEHCVHCDDDRDSYYHEIFGKSTELRGYIDLVFKWEGIVVLGEIKSGMISEESEKIWRRQMAAYMEIWEDIYESKTVDGYIIHPSIYNGYQQVDAKESPLSFNHTDESSRFLNEGCDYCYLRSRCHLYNE